MPTPPLSRKVLVGFFIAVIVAVIQAVVPGYSPDPTVTGLIDIGAGYAASFVVAEELKFLVPATAAAKVRAARK